MLKTLLNLIRIGLIGHKDSKTSPRFREVTVFAFGIGFVYSLYFYTLAHGGHAPSSTRGLFVSASNFYFVASLYTTLLIPGLTFVACWSAGLAMGRNRQHTIGDHWVHLGPAYLSPMLMLYLIPECVIYAVYGFETLASAVRILGSLFAITVFVRFYQILGQLYPGQRIRTVLATTAAAIAQAIPAVFLIR